MTLEEAQKIARVIGTADGACPSCVGSLVYLMSKEFPEFVWSDTKNTHNDYFNGAGNLITEEEYYNDVQASSLLRIIINVRNDK